MALAMVGSGVHSVSGGSLWPSVMMGGGMGAGLPVPLGCLCLSDPGPGEDLLPGWAWSLEMGVCRPDVEPCQGMKIQYLKELSYGSVVKTLDSLPRGHGSNLHAMAVVPVGKAFYPHCLVPLRRLKYIGPLVANLHVQATCFLVGWFLESEDQWEVSFWQQDFWWLNKPIGERQTLVLS